MKIFNQIQLRLYFKITVIWNAFNSIESIYKSMKNLVSHQAYFRRIKHVPKWLIKFNKHLFEELEQQYLIKNRQSDYKIKPMIGFGTNQVHR